MLNRTSTLYPLLWRPPTPSLFVSADPRVLVVAAAGAVVVFVADRRFVWART